MFLVAIEVNCPGHISMVFEVMFLLEIFFVKT